MTRLPRLELADHTSPFDEAVILIDGHDEETITIECEGALELAGLIIRLVNEFRAWPTYELQTPYRVGAGVVGQMGELS